VRQVSPRASRISLRKAGTHAAATLRVNSIESVCALFKRQVYGIHHFVSAKHLHRCISEATWRFNRRDLKDAPRMNEFLTRANERLTYGA
jgi:hypothetical protein